MSKRRDRTTEARKHKDTSEAIPETLDAMKSAHKLRLGLQNFDGVYARRASLTVDVLFRIKWKICILCAIRNGPVRLGQLGRLIPGVSKKMLSQNLKQLEADGIVVRRDLSEIVLHVEYELRNDLRGSIEGLLDHLAQWGENYFIGEHRE